MPPSSLVWKSDLARIRVFLHLSYGRLLGIPPYISIYNHGIWWDITFETELYTPCYYYFWDRCGTHAVKLSQIQISTAAAETLAYKALENTVLKGHCLLLKWIAADLQRTATGQQRTASGLQRTASAGFYTKLIIWGSLGLNFDYDGGPIIENGGPICLYMDLP